MNASLLVYGGDPVRPPFNLLHSMKPTSDFSVRDMGFVGGRPRQVVSGRDGQAGFAVYLRGSLQRVAFHDCLFEGFGDGRSGGGGIVLGSAPGWPDAGLSDIEIEGCTFIDNGNVPGLYVSGGDTGDVPRRSIRIRGNKFGGIGGSTKVQNAIYVLGAPGATIRHVDISRNEFDFSTPVDAAIELNWVSGFSISGNTIHFEAAMPDSTGVLLRDGTSNGTVAGNTLTNAARPAENLKGIVLVNFSHPGEITDIVISHNLVSGFIGAVAVDRGSQGIIVADNRIRGSADDGDTFGIRLADTTSVSITGNMVSSVREAVTLATGDRSYSALRDIRIQQNVFDDCGGEGATLISARQIVNTDAVAGLTISGNAAWASRPGTAAALDPRLAQLVSE